MKRSDSYRCLDSFPVTKNEIGMSVGFLFISDMVKWQWLDYTNCCYFYTKEERTYGKSGRKRNE